MIIYAASITPRLRYVSDFIGDQLTGQCPTLTDDPNHLRSFNGLRINYSETPVPGETLRIHPASLLFESGIRPQSVRTCDWRGLTALFPTDGDLPFDLFAAVFYLLSRYEEYLPFHHDSYGRYPHTESIAYREGFLHRPQVNRWLRMLLNMLRERNPLFPIRPVRFEYIPTYDIDEAYSYRYKSWWRRAGGAFQDLLMARLRRFDLRRNVLKHLVPDPFDSYDWIDDLHGSFPVSPRYFFLVAVRNGRYDRNILPHTTALQTLMQRHAVRYQTGLHPSWQSGDRSALLLEEKELMERILRIEVTASRQHFIRFRLPETYRLLIDAGIREEYSMGYGGSNGFRASVASPFYWYDLEREQVTPLQLFPFCYMESTSFYKERSTPEEALQAMRSYLQEVRAVDGTLITVWHNTTLGTDPRFAGWRDAYASFFKEAFSA
ncbi:MAG: hypothetical protein RJA57_1262 [Bacteroidota bacterium]